MEKDPAEWGVIEEVPLSHPPPLRIFDSPCKSVCRIDERVGWCIGCRRTRAEIKAWSTASDAQKRAILEGIAARAEAEAGLLEAAAPLSAQRR